MKETKLHPCNCGGEMKIEKVAQNGGMDGTYYNWELTCSKCGLTKTYAADGFYGRKYKKLEEVVSDWNRNREKEKFIKADVLDKVRAEIEEVYLNLTYVENYNRGASWGLRKALKIIDKYKAESEGV